MNLGRIYEQSYNTQDISGDAILLLRTELVKMYQAALEVMADAGNLLDKGTAGRTMEAILFPHKTSGLYSDLASHEANVERAANGCGAAANASLLESMRGPVARVDKSVEKLLEEAEYQTLVDTLDWISDMDFLSLHKVAQKKRTPETCEWLLQHAEFRTWNDVSASSILCIEGSREYTQGVQATSFPTNFILSWDRENGALVHGRRLLHPGSPALSSGGSCLLLLRTVRWDPPRLLNCYAKLRSAVGVLCRLRDTKGHKNEPTLAPA